MTNKEKLDAIVETLCYGKKVEMLRRLGMNNSSTLSTWYARNSIDVERVAKAFPELNPEWLIFGKEPMMNAERKEQEAEQPQEDFSQGYNENGIQCLQVAEGQPFDLAWFNATLRENAQLKHQIETLRARNLELEKQNAVLEERMTNAEKWYYSNYRK